MPTIFFKSATLRTLKLKHHFPVFASWVVKHVLIWGAAMDAKYLGMATVTIIPMPSVSKACHYE